MANRRLVSNWYKTGQETDFLTLAEEGDILEVWNWLPFSSNHWGVLTSLSEGIESTTIAHKVTGQPSGIALVSLANFSNKQSYRINNSSDGLWKPGTPLQIIKGAMDSRGPNADLGPYDFAVRCRANLLRGNPAPEVKSSIPPPTLPKPHPNAIRVLPPLNDFQQKK